MHPGHWQRPALPVSMVLPSRVAPARPGKLSFIFIHVLLLTLSQNICGLCGHGIHTHVDYVSTVVNNYPANQCAAYVQRVCRSSSHTTFETHDGLRCRHLLCSFAPVKPNFASTSVPVIHIVSRSHGKFCTTSIRTVMALLPVSPRADIPTTPIAHLPQTAYTLLPLITTLQFFPAMQGTFPSLPGSFIRLLPAVPHTLFNRIPFRSQITVPTVTSLGIPTRFSTRLILVRRVARRMEASDTRIMGMRCTPSPVKPGWAYTDP